MPMLISNVSKIAMDVLLRSNNDVLMARLSMPGREDVLLQLQLQHQPEPLPLLALPPGVQEEDNFSELLEIRMVTLNANSIAMDASPRLSKDVATEKPSMQDRGNVWPLALRVLFRDVLEEASF